MPTNVIAPQTNCFLIFDSIVSFTFNFINSVSDNEPLFSEVLPISEKTVAFKYVITGDAKALNIEPIMAKTK